jgi:hypothetical protein
VAEQPREPWTYRTTWDDDGDLCYQIKEGEKTIGFVYGEDTARLIAAGPEFYAAAVYGPSLNLPEFLDWLADRLTNTYGESPEVDFVISLRERARLLRAAIARAEGRPA